MGQERTLRILVLSGLHTNFAQQSAVYVAVSVAVEGWLSTSDHPAGTPPTVSPHTIDTATDPYHVAR